LYKKANGKWKWLRVEWAFKQTPSVNQFGEFDDKKAKYNKLEQYKVIAYKDKKHQKKKDIIATRTLKTRTGAPWGFKSKLVDYLNIRLSWKEVSGVSGYIVYRSTNESKGYKQVQKITSAGITSWTDENLKYSATYYYKLSSYKGKKKGTKSNPISQKTLSLE
jgi:hypothetical protein